MSWSHVEDRDVLARKPHKCWLCGEGIDAGTVYRRRVGFSEDGPSTMRMHLECESETRDWDLLDWETCCCGDMVRPSRSTA